VAQEHSQYYPWRHSFGDLIQAALPDTESIVSAYKGNKNRSRRTEIEYNIKKNLRVVITLSF